jgi:hypothetical protein
MRQKIAYLHMRRLAYLLRNNISAKELYRISREELEERQP